MSFGKSVSVGVCSCTMPIRAQGLGSAQLEKKLWQLPWLWQVWQLWQRWYLDQPCSFYHSFSRIEHSAIIDDLDLCFRSLQQMETSP